MPNLGELVGDFQWRESVIVTNVAFKPLVSPDATRWALILSVHTGDQPCLISTLASTAVGQGLNIMDQNSPYIMNFRDWGGIVCEGWNVRTTAVNSLITVIEVLYRPQGFDLRSEAMMQLAERLRR